MKTLTNCSHSNDAGKVDADAEVEAADTDGVDGCKKRRQE